MNTVRPAPAHPRHGPGWPLLAVLGGGVTLVIAAWLVIGGPLSNSGGQRPRPYVEAIVGEPSRASPLFAYLNDADRDIVSLVFSGLTRLGPDGEVLPDLAESWEISDDGTSITFHLRSGVTWHTGVPFTSADVIFTYGLLADPKLGGNPDEAPLWRQVSCTAPDDMTVICRLPEPYSPFMSYTTTGIVPKHLLEGEDVANLRDSSFNRAPIGTGPYRAVQFDNSQVVLKANPKYHLGQPGIPEIRLRFYPDYASATAGVVRGEADGIIVDPGISQADFDTLAKARGLKAYSANRTASTILYLNNGASPLSDKAVREAIARAINIDDIIGGVLGGRATRASSPIPPGTWAYNPDVKPVQQSVSKARELLGQAGWTLPEGKEIREKDGTELRITLMTDQNASRGALAEAIARQLANAGIGVTVVRQDSTSLVRDYLIPRQYQAAIFGWDPGPDPDPYPAWHSSQATGNGRNLAAFGDEQTDAILEKARRTWNLDERQRLYYTFQSLFQQDLPSIPLYYPVYTYFVSDEVKGIQLGTLFGVSSRFRNVYEWSLAGVRGPRP